MTTNVFDIKTGKELKQSPFEKGCFNSAMIRISPFDELDASVFGVPLEKYGISDVIDLDQEEFVEQISDELVVLLCRITSIYEHIQIIQDMIDNKEG